MYRNDVGAKDFSGAVFVLDCACMVGMRLILPSLRLVTSATVERVAHNVDGGRKRASLNNPLLPLPSLKVNAPIILHFSVDWLANKLQ